MIEESLEVKLPTYGLMQQQWWEQSEKRKAQQRKSQQKEEAHARKGRKVVKHCFFNVLWLRRVAIWPDEREKIALGCRAKHILKSRCIKHHRFGPLLEVKMFK
jgi:hypothetical protein